MTKPRILTIMGSGETAPTMVSTHRNLVARLTKPVAATVIDTPYGFQANADELAERAVAYFDKSVTIDIQVAGLLRLKGDSVDRVAIERGLRRVADADYVFAGPGSPTYALRQWKDTPLHDVLATKIREGGLVTFASAAALTLGAFTVPVYEIYKVGEEPRWEEGLDLLGEIGIHAAVIPHYDNAEGGNHDTRFCYLGQGRLEYLESLLPHDHFVLGIDEHTALVIDIDNGTASVTGKGGVTVRLRGSERIFRSGEEFPVSVLQDPAATTQSGSSPAARGAETPSPQQPTPATSDLSPLERELATHREVFRTALDSRDAEGAVRAALALELSIVDDGDDNDRDAVTRARAELRSMISSLGDAAVGGVQDPREVVGPFVEAMLAVRRTVRAEKRYDLSDIIRDSFDALGVEVRDTPDGVEWNLRA